jgi:hypothetical protein
LSIQALSENTAPFPPLFVSVPGQHSAAHYGERRAKAARQNSSW